MNRALLILCLVLIAGVVHAKTARTYYDEDTMAKVNAKIEKYDWAKGQVASAKSGGDWYLKMSDQELWDFVPPPEQLRAINVCHGRDCPYCGEEIIRKGGAYPWKMDREKPFKVTCPVCGRTFPENDFQPWNTAGKDGEPESGMPITDKGIGWVDKEGHRYYFVSYYIFWQRWTRDIIGGMGSLGQAYLLSGDPVYAHKAAIMMAKLAGEYKDFHYPTQCYHEGIWGVNGRISDYIWTTGNDSTIALAYDAIYPVFDQDKELLAFLKDKGIDNPREFIELKMINVMADDILTGYAQGNMGAHQRTGCHLAIVLDNDDPARGHTTQEMRDWLMKGNGRIEDLLWNGFWRDGLGGESSPGYSSGWCSKFYELAELLPRLGIQIWDNPKLRKMADIGIDLTVAGKFCPCIGDAGGVMGSGPVAMSVGLQGRAFTRYGDPKYAKALKRMNARATDLWEDYFDEEAVNAIVAKEGTDMGWKTRNLGGYGLAILESGTEGSQRAVTMYYGDATGGHGHRDRLTLGFFAYGHPMFPEMGYPTPFRTPKRGGWTSNTASHYSVLINQMPQTSAQRGYLNTLAASPAVKLMDASAEVAYGTAASLYRRTCALVDISDDNSYLLDVFRVRGGSEHHWSYHGPAHFSDFSVTGGELGPVQEKGTLAGEDVAYGGTPPATVTKRGIALNLRAAKGLITEGFYGETASNGWAIYGGGFLTRKPGAEVTIETPEIPAGKIKVFMRMYDYNKGTNITDIKVGDATATLTCEPSGKVGNRWISEVIELQKPATEVVVTATQAEQTYAQLDSIVISQDLRAAEPVLAEAGQSGFQYLFNIRRMKPTGSWSAMWTKPDEGLSMTTTVPAGCVQEVITGDGIPELQPGNPNTIQYVLGHNELDTDGDQALFRSYIAVTEPHRGQAAVTGAERLKADNASDETVGLVVRRGAVRDLIHSSLTPAEKCEWKGGDKPFVVAAEFAMLTLDDRGIQRAVVVNGTLLEYGDFSLNPAPSPEGKVLTVDFEHNSITIDIALKMPEACRDNVAILGNELQRTSYTIEGAKVTGGTTTLDFGHTLFVLAMGAVAETNMAAKTLTSATELSGYGHTDGGRHEGRWLYNEDKSKGFRIASVSGKTFTLESIEGDLGAVFNDSDGDGRRQWWVSDIGPGDTCRIPSTTYYARK